MMSVFNELCVVYGISKLTQLTIRMFLFLTLYVIPASLICNFNFANYFDFYVVVLKDKQHGCQLAMFAKLIQKARSMFSPSGYF